MKKNTKSKFLVRAKNRNKKYKEDISLLKEELTDEPNTSLIMEKLENEINNFDEKIEKILKKLSILLKLRMSGLSF